MDQQQDRPSSVGPQSHITRHYQEDSGLGFALDPLLSTTNNQQFSNSREYSNSFLASQQIQQYPQATIRETNFSPNQDLNSQSDQIAQEEVSQQNQSSISPFGHQHQTSFTEELLNANTFAEGDFSLYSNPGGPEEQFEHAFFLNDPSQDSPPSVNPADVMSDMSSPQVQHTPTPPHVLYDPHQSSSAHASPSFNQHQFQQPRGIKVEHQQPSSTHASPPFNQHQFQSSGLKSETKQSSSTHNSPSFNQNQFQHPPTHSRNTSLGPESAVFPQAQMSTEWSMMPPQFTNHRRSPSEYSDVSSAAPSPNLPQQDTFEPTEQNPSPLVHPQDSGLYKDVLEIRNFSLSDSQAQHGASPHRGLSPAHTPSMSPRLGPQPMPMINQSAFMLNAGMSDNGFGPSVPDMYDSQNQGQFGRNSSVEVGPGPGPGQAQQMMPPEINVEFAPTSRQSSFDPPKPSLDQDSLTPPSQIRRVRAHSDPYNHGSVNSRSGTPANLPPAGVSDAYMSDQEGRSLSPHDRSTTSSPSNRRRQSTSALPNRDYVLGIVNPDYQAAQGSPENGTPKRAQKHPATFQCTLCPKRFTRAYNLRSHLRTHTDERPFVCTVCGKAFARQHDRKRHEGLHSGEKKFICKGDLKQAGQWGCGRRFARADALGRHFRSEAGRICIKPLLDEEAIERQRLWHEQHMQSMAQNMHHPPPPMTVDANGLPVDSSGNYSLPAALIAQYPVLATLSWQDLSQGDAAMEEDLSGRSSFDASGSEYYDEGDDGGYVSGPGTGFGPGHGQSQVNDGYRVDYAGDFTGR